MSTKAFSCFFLLLTILNLPVLIFFGTGNSAGEYERFTDIFAILSMGNVGQSGFSCSGVKVKNMFEKDPASGGYNDREQLRFYNRESYISINCGIGSKIKGLAQIGINKDDESTCKDILEDTTEFQDSFQKDGCYYKNKTANDLFDYDDVATTKKAAKDKGESGKL